MKGKCEHCSKRRKLEARETDKGVYLLCGRCQIKLDQSNLYLRVSASKCARSKA